MSYSKRLESYIKCLEQHPLITIDLNSLSTSKMIIWTRRGLILKELSSESVEQRGETQQFEPLEQDYSSILTREEELIEFINCFLPGFSTVKTKTVESNSKQDNNNDNLMSRVYEYLSETKLNQNYSTECIAFMSLDYIGNAQPLIQSKQYSGDELVINISTQHALLQSPGFSFSEQEFNLLYKEMDLIVEHDYFNNDLFKQIKFAC